MDSLKSGKLAMHFIYQGIEFQMNVTKHFIDLFSKYLALFLVHRNQVLNAIVWNSKISDARPCLTLNISVSNC